MSGYENDHKDYQLDKLLRDNEKIKSELRRTREENRKLKHIISYGNLSTLSTLIDQYMDYSRTHLKKIATEIQLTDYEQDSLDKVMELIGHLEHIEQELYKLIEIGEEGRMAHNDSLKAGVRLARNLGNVYDYTRHIKSILFGDKFEKLAETNANETANDEKNSTPFSESIFLETADALEVIGAGTEKITKTVALDETNPYLQQGNSDDWETYNVSDSDRQAKYRWLDGTYREFADKSREALSETDASIIAAQKIIEHTNLAAGDLQLSQAQNELKTLLAYELARQNVLDANLAQLQAVYQANEYDETVAAAYWDSVTKMDVVDPYDEVTYKMLEAEYGYGKAKPAGMPDFK